MTLEQAGEITLPGCKLLDIVTTVMKNSLPRWFCIGDAGNECQNATRIKDVLKI